MDLQTSVSDFIRKKNLFPSGGRLLLAVSGGVDSVVLCELCKRMGYEFDIAHCNFRLRGADSEADENFVQSLALKHGANFQSVQFDTKIFAEEKKIGIQEAARELRYAWLNKIADESGCRYIVTAHHADDNAETLLMNFLKGTGIKGLQGMSPREAGIGGKIVRPLLEVRKSAILSFANDNNLTWREDASNESSYYTRNFLRNDWLPSVETIMPQVKQNLIANLERFKEANILYQEGLHAAIRKLVVKKGEECHIPVNKLKKLEAGRTILYEILKPCGFTAGQSEEAWHLLSSPSGKYIDSASHKLLKNREWLILAPQKTEHASVYVVDNAESVLSLPIGKLSLEKTEVPAHIPAENNVALLDDKDIAFPLIVRPWKQGDYFYPLGMSKKKKLSRFFIDAKLSQLQKEKVYVVESDKRIIWVMGLRIDNRFRITDNTNSVLAVTLTPAK